MRYFLELDDHCNESQRISSLAEIIIEAICDSPSDCRYMAGAIEILADRLREHSKGLKGLMDLMKGANV